MPVSARALISFKGLPTESEDGYIQRGEVFDVADQARYNYLASIGFVQDPNLPWGPGETTLPQIEERLPADLFQSGRPGYVQFKTIPEVKLSGSSDELPVKAPPIKGMAIASITIGSTATELKAGASPLANRKQIMIEAPSAGVIYWGASGVTAATGFSLAAGSQPMYFDVDSASPKIYAVSDGTNRTVKVGEFA